MVKSPAAAVPPLSFTTCLITVSVAVGMTASKHSPFVFGPPVVWFGGTPGEAGAKGRGGARPGRGAAQAPARVRRDVRPPDEDRDGAGHGAVRAAERRGVRDRA